MESTDNHNRAQETAKMKENKKAIENKLVARILRLLKNNGQDKPRKRSEIIGLVHEFNKQYQSLYAQYDHLKGQMGKRNRSKKQTETFSSTPSSESEYYSSDEIENGKSKTHNYEASESEIENSGLLSSTSTENETHLTKQSNRRDKKNEGNERKLEASVIKASDQIKELERQLTMLRIDLESSRKLNNDLRIQIEEKQGEAKGLQESNVQLQSRVSELELMLQEKGNEISELTLKMAGQEKDLTSKIEMLMAQVKERDEELAEVQRLRDENESMKEEMARKAHFEQELLKEKQSSLVQMEDLKSEMNSLNDQRKELEETITRKTQETNELREENDRLQQELSSLVSKKSNLKASSAQNLIEMESETLNQTNKNPQQHKLEKTQSLDVHKLQKLESSRTVNHQALERKVAELAENFQMKMENQIRLLAQRIRVAEQIQAETKDSYKKRKEKLEVENEELKEKNATYEAESQKIQVVFSESGRNIMSGLDLMAKKLDEENGKFFHRISRISNELQVAREWITGKNDETRKLKQNLEDFCSQQGDDKEENVECLFTEKMREASQLLERRVEDLEQQLEERYEIMSSLKEEKREAIRQLCYLIDYHRYRYDHLKEAVAKMPIRFRKPS